MRVDKTAAYRCDNDCRQEGCPGHTLTLRWHNTSAIYQMLIDGDEKDSRHFDPKELQVLTNLYRQHTER